MSAQDMMYEWLKDRIASVPRDEFVFLTEAEIAAESGVSRTPVREALLRLETEGLVQILPKKGAVVRSISDAELESTMEARLLVERFAAQRAVEMKTLDIESIDGILTEQELLLREGDFRGFINADRRFHGVIVSAAQNTVLDDFYESLRDRQIRMGLRAVSSSDDRGESVLREHQAIRDALRSGDLDATDAAVIAHLTTTHAILRDPTRQPGSDRAASRGVGLARRL